VSEKTINTEPEMIGPEPAKVYSASPVLANTQSASRIDTTGDLNISELDVQAPETSHVLDDYLIAGNKRGFTDWLAKHILFMTIALVLLIAVSIIGSAMFVQSSRKQVEVVSGQKPSDVSARQDPLEGYILTVNGSLQVNGSGVVAKKLKADSLETNQLIVNGASITNGNLEARSFSGFGGALTGVNAASLDGATLAQLLALINSKGALQGNGNAGRLAFFSNGDTLTDSRISQSGSVISVDGSVVADNLQGNGTLLTDLNAANVTSGLLALTRGGTGLDASTAGNGTLLIGNGNGFTLANLAQGSGISITNGSGAITIAVDSTVCTTSNGLCTPSGGSIGSGTTNFIPRWVTPTSIGNSIISQSGSSLINIAGSLTTSAGLQGNSLSIGGGGFAVSNTGSITAATGITSSGTVSFSSLNAVGVVHTSATGVLSTSAVLLGTDTSGSFVANLGTLTGLGATGNSGANSTPNLSVLYGGTANTAAQGNTNLSFTGSGNLTGTVSATAGGGVASNTLAVVNNPTFSGLLSANGGVQFSDGTFNGNLTQTGSGTIILGSLGSGIVQTNGSGVVTSGVLDRNSLSLSGQTNVGNGGTGATTASGARTNLGAAASGANGDITNLNAVTSISAASALTIGNIGQQLTLQGNASTVFQAVDNGNTVTLSFQTPTANVVYRLPAASAGTYDLCSTAGNCAGTGNGVTTTGGTINTIAMFTGSQAIANSVITQAGSKIGIGTSASSSGALLQIGGNTTTSDGGISFGDVSLFRINTASLYTGGSFGASGVIYSNYGFTGNSLQLYGGNSGDLFTTATAINIGDTSGITRIRNALTVAGQITSSVAAGTAPIVIASSTLVTNLNADLLDGYHASSFATASGSGNYIQNQSASAQSANFFIQTSAANIVGGIIRGATAQTADILQLQNAGGATVARFDSNGKLIIGGTGNPGIIAFGRNVDGAGNGSIGYPNTTNELRITESSGNGFITFTTNSGEAMRINNFGNVGIGISTPINARLQVVTSSASGVGQIVQAQSGQTADLVEYRNSGGTVLSGFTAGGNLFYQNSGFISTFSQANLTQNQTIVIPASSASSDTVCLVSLGNCTGGASGAVTTVGTLDGGTANANGATITTNTIFLQSASATNAGLVNTAAQTFVGNKTFTGNTGFSAVGVGTGTSSSTLLRVYLPATGKTSGITITNKAGNSSGSALAISDQDGNRQVSFSGSTGQLILGTVATSGTVYQGQLAFADGTVSGFTGTLQSTTLTANRTYTLPDADGTLCVQGSTSCGFAPTTGGTGYIQNQNSAQQTPANFYIETGRASNFYSTQYDTATSNILYIGQNNASSIVLGRATTAQNSITVCNSCSNRLNFGSASIQFGTASNYDVLLSRTGAAALTLAGNLTITSQTASNAGLILKGAASQTADLLRFQNPSGTANYSGFDASGYLYYQSGSFISTLTQGSLSQNQTITIPASNGATDTVCLLNLQNCVGTGSSVTGSGTANYLAKFNGGQAIASSQLFDNGSFVGVNTATQLGAGQLSIQTSSALMSGIVIQGSASQTAPYFQILSSAGGTVTSVDSNGVLRTAGGYFGNWGIQQINNGINFNVDAFGQTLIQTYGATNTALRVRAKNASQSADLFQVQNNSQDVLSKFMANGQLVLGTVGTTTGAAVQGSLGFADGTTDGFIGTLRTSTLTANRVYTLPDSTGTVCLDTGNCAIGSGSGNYIQNQTAGTQTANFNIQGVAGTVTMIVQGVSGQDIAAFRSSDGITRSKIGSGGEFIGSLGIFGSSASNKNASLNVRTGSGTSNGIVVSLENSQSGDALSVRNGGNIPLIGINASGQLFNQNNGFTGTFVQTGLTVNRTYSLPDETGTICIQLSASCGFASASGSGSYIQNSTVQQPNANFNISGAGAIGNTLNVAGSTTLSGQLTLNANLLLTNNADANVAVGIIGTAGQSANLLEISRSGDTTPRISIISTGSGFNFSPGNGAADVNLTRTGSGVLTVNNSFSAGTLYAGAYFVTGAGRLNVSTANAAGIGAVIRGSASQTGDLLQIQDNTGAVLASINAAATLTANKGQFANGLSTGSTSSTAQSAGILFGDVSISRSSGSSLSVSGSLVGSGQVGSAFGLLGNQVYLYSGNTASVYTGAANINIGTSSGTAIKIGSTTGSTTVQNTLLVNGSAYATRFAAGNSGTGQTTTFNLVPNNVGDVGIAISSRSGQTADLFQLGDASNNILSGFNAAGQLFYNNGGFSSTFATSTLTANRSYTLPNASGIVCLDTGNCSLGGGSGSYIQNQNSAQQAASNFWISGTGRSDGGFIASSLDTAAANSSLNLGNNNATTINLGAADNVGRTINIGTSTTANTQIINIGSTSASSGLTLAAGSNGMQLLSPNIFNKVSSTFRVQDAGGNNLFTVNTPSSTVSTAFGTLLQAGGSLQVNGSATFDSGITLGSSGTNTYITPLGASLQTRINIPNFTVGNFGSVLAFGIPGASSSTARGLLVADERSSTHQATIGVLSPNESDIFGLAWDGGNTNALLSTLSSSSHIILTIGGTQSLDVYNGGAFVRGTLSVTTGNASYDRIAIQPANVGSAVFDGIITNIDLTANRTYTLPDESGTLCVIGGASCNAGYIANQSATVQTGTFNVNGFGRSTSGFLSGYFDTGGTGVVSIATTNASSVSLGKSGVLTTVNGAIALNGGATVKPATNSSDPFQVLNFNGTSALRVDQYSQTYFTGNIIGTGTLSLGEAYNLTGARLNIHNNTASDIGVLVRGTTGQTGDLLQLQDINGNVLAGISSIGNLTVKNAVINGTLTIKGHIITGNTAGSTTIAVGADAPCSGGNHSASIIGNDTAGRIVVNVGTGSCAMDGEMAIITFAQSYVSEPTIMLTPKNAASAAAQYYYVASGTGFRIYNGDYMQPGQTYEYSYQIMQ
jgi:hypothetical protein